MELKTKAMMSLTLERYNELIDAERVLNETRCNAYDGQWPHLCELDREHTGEHWSKVLGHFRTREEIFKICACNKGECIAQSLITANPSDEVERMRPVGWIQEICGIPIFRLGDTDPREAYDSGEPCYQVYAKAKP